MLRSLEGEALGAFGAIERRCFDKLSQREVPRNDEGARAGKMLAGRNRPERLRKMF